MHSQISALRNGLKVYLSGRATLHSMPLLSVAIQITTVSGCIRVFIMSALKYLARVHVGTNATTLQLKSHSGLDQQKPSTPAILRR
jgi:hypothetical protein